MDDKLKQQIKDQYQKGVSPLMLSLQNNIEVAQVYEILEQPEMNYVRVSNGDMVDNVGPGATINGPEVQRQPYSKN